MTTENDRDLTAEFEGENGRVLTREQLLRGVLYGDVETTEDGYIADSELFTPVADEDGPNSVADSDRGEPARPERPGPDATSGEIAEWLEGDFWAAVAEGPANETDNPDEDTNEKRHLDLTDMYVSECGRVLTRERLFRIGLHEGGLSEDGDCYVLNGERYTPVTDEEEIDD